MLFLNSHIQQSLLKIALLGHFHLGLGCPVTETLELVCLHPGLCFLCHTSQHTWLEQVWTHLGKSLWRERERGRGREKESKRLRQKKYLPLKTRTKEHVLQEK